MSRHLWRLGALLIIFSLGACSSVASPSADSAAGSPRPAVLGLEDLGFFRIVGAGDHNNLEVGTLDGTIAERIALTDQMGQLGDGGQWASGPHGGLVLFGDGTGLFVIDVNGRGTRRIANAPAVIHHGALSPDGRTAYFAVREIGSANWSLWRVAVAGGEPQRLRGPLGDSVARRGIVLAAVLLPRAQVAVSPDGRTVALNECVTECRLFVLDVASGARRQLTEAESPDGNMAALIGQHALPDVGDAVALGADGHAYLVQGAVVIDVGTGDEREIPVQDGREIFDGWVFTSWVGAEMTPGWTLAVEALSVPADEDEDCNTQFVAMNMETGELVELPVLGPTAFCG